MSDHNNARRAACALAALLLTLCAAPLLAQGATLTHRGASVREALARFEQEQRVNRPGNRGGISAVYRILAQPEQHRPATLDSLVAGLENLMLTSDHPSVRSAAAAQLGIAGQNTRKHPRPGTVARLSAGYSRSSDPVVQAVLIGEMSKQAERQLATKFLQEVALQAPPRTDHVEESAQLYALSALARMGEEGRAALRELHRGNRVRDPSARGYLSHLHTRGFRSQ